MHEVKVQDAQYLRGEDGEEEGRDDGEEGVSEDPKVDIRSCRQSSVLCSILCSLLFFFFSAEQNINRNKLGKKV